MRTELDMNDKCDGPVGYNAEAYQEREKGYSPEPIRDAAWEIVGEQVGGNVLDVGSGEGGWIQRLQLNSVVKKIISADIVDDGASRIEGVEFHLVDVSCAPLPCMSSTVDWIFALEVIEHLSNPRHFIAEAHRSLKSGGKLFITTPCNDSLTARLSFLFRGYFPAFCDHDYRVAGHIMPITEIDMRRMAAEIAFKKVDFYYPLPGRIPKSNLHWQRILPGLRGKLWSDSLFVLLTK